jgi:UDP-3-O-[3-hydroxymyristoyl] glucosamine N-acyltransferase
MIKCKELVNSWPELFELFSGSLDVEFSDIAPIEEPRRDTIVFLPTHGDIKKALESLATGLVISKKRINEIPSTTGKTILASKNVNLALAYASHNYFARDPRKTVRERIHPSAVIAKTAKIAADSVIGANAVIGENVSIGRGTWIGANAVIEENSTIGENTLIHALVYIGWETRIGNHCEVKPHTAIGGEGYGYAQDENGHHHHIPQRGRVVLEDHVTIGSHCAIDRSTFGETRIGTGTKFDNHIHIAHNCRVGRHTLLTAGFKTAGSTSVGDHCVTGGNVSLKDHVKICDHVQLAGLTGVQHDITAPGAYGGHPIQPIKEYLKTLSLIKQLPEIKKNIQRILKHLGL